MHDAWVAACGGCQAKTSCEGDAMHNQLLPSVLFFQVSPLEALHPVQTNDVILAVPQAAVNLPRKQVRVTGLI